MPPTAIILLSGGLDSATALAFARAEGFRCHCLCFDYGQRHRFELIAAQRVAESLHAAEFLTFKLDLRAFGGSALTADIDVPKNRDEHEISSGIPITYVPARNLVFLSIASGLAEVRGATCIFAGVNAVDYSGYPDCRPEFIRSFEQTVNLGTKAGVDALKSGSHAIDIRTPLIDLSKAEIIRRGVQLGVDYSLTHSCYDPDSTGGACGACDSCRIRAAGFKAAGVKDPTRYR
ncbi:MAG: 7-cyano-7-deazaguanine synthase QueC [Phycisphaerales bacterium]|jgi:7-cyano-7-deazaguanine synthase